jgi:hypothetical protein
MSDYSEHRHPKLEDLGITYCYICLKTLVSETTPDHIIPKAIFRKGDPYRPTLPVHPQCNNTKSKEDEWCVRFLQFYAGFSGDAQAEFIKLAQKAQAEKPFAFLIGHKNRNYKLAMSLLGNLRPGIKIKHNGQSLHEFHIGKKESTRLSDWMKLICRGLYVRNVIDAHPADPKLKWSQLALAKVKGQQQLFIKPVENLVNNSGGSSFGQAWGSRVAYIGSRVTETPNKGYLFIHFYDQVGILAAFRTEGAHDVEN